MERAMSRFFLQRFTGSLRVSYVVGLRNGRLFPQTVARRDFCFAHTCSNTQTTHHSLFCNHPEFRTCSAPAVVVASSTVGLPRFAVCRAYGTKKVGVMSELMTDKENGSAAKTTFGSAFGRNPQAYKPPLDLLHQSEEVPDMPSARTSSYCKGGQVVEYLHDDVRTFYDSFKRGAQIAGSSNCLGWKPSKSSPFKWMTYNQVLERAENIGSGFICKGIEPTNSSRIGLFCRNTPEYVITDLACATYSMVLVPLYDTLGPDTCTFIINQANIKLVLCDSRERVMKLLREKSQTPNMKTVVCFHCVSSAVKHMTMTAHIDVVTFDQLEPCVPDDLCTICYTSGTTGKPKGAMITHKNLIASTSAIALHLECLKFCPDDVYMSYLPLPHIYEKVTQAFLYSCGCQVGFFQGDMLLFKNDIKELRPTVFATVPRLLNRIYGKFTSQVSKSYIKNYVYQMGFKNKLSEIERGIIRKNSIWDFLVFRKVRDMLGGRIRAVICGSAPLSPDVINFTRVALGCVIMEAYGLTETTSIVSSQIPGDYEAGTVGAPFPANIVKLIDIPEMDYYAKDQRGEVCVKGANVFVGYLDEPERMAETVDKDGWMHTGDVGMWLPNGALKIIDRKKNIFKLSQGEYIAPEKIENIYVSSEAIAQVMVHGNSLEESLVGIVVPDHDELCYWVKKTLNIDGTSITQLCSLPEVKQAILEDMWAIGNKAGLQSFEQVKDIHLTTEMFSIENAQLTPTQKIKRYNIDKHYAQEIKEMYAQLGQ